MMEAITPALSNLIVSSPFLVVAASIIYYFYKENKELRNELKSKEDKYNIDTNKLNDEIRELNKKMRESDARNTQILSGVTSTLDKVLTDNKNTTNELKSFIEIKLLELKNDIE